MKLQECINFILTNAQNSVFLYFKKSLQPLNVTPIQYALLKCLWDEDNQVPSQLAQTLCLDSSTITGILSRLEEKGYVERSFCKTDRRKVTVCLTEAGRGLQKPVEGIIAQANIAVTGDIPAEEIASFKDILQKIQTNAQEKSI